MDGFANQPRVGYVLYEGLIYPRLQPLLQLGIFSATLVCLANMRSHMKPWKTWSQTAFVDINDVKSRFEKPKMVLILILAIDVPIQLILK